MNAKHVAEILLVATMAAVTIGWGIFFGWLLIAKFAGSDSL